MSLINDALKKARLDADRQQTAKRRDFYDTAPSPVPARKRARQLAVLAIGILIAASTVIAGVVLIIRLQGPDIQRLGIRPLPPASDSSGSETGEGPAAAATAPGEEPSLDVAVPSARPQPEDEAPLVAARPRPARPKRPSGALAAARRRSTAQQEPIRSLPADPESLAAIPARSRNRANRPSRRIPPRPSSGSQDEPRAFDSLDGKSFLKKVSLPDGGNLELSGIAWSDVHPVAVISGSVVGAGEFVEGFKVLEIGPNSVQLQRDGSTFSLRLR